MSKATVTTPTNEEDGDEVNGHMRGLSPFSKTGDGLSPWICFVATVPHKATRSMFPIDCTPSFSLACSSFFLLLCSFLPSLCFHLLHRPPLLHCLDDIFKQL